MLVDSAAHEPSLSAPAGVTVRFLHREAGDDLVDAVRAVPWREGRVHAFVHGEAEPVMHAIRPYLLRERGRDRDQVSVSGYWRRGDTEEGFRAWKAAERASV